MRFHHLVLAIVLTLASASAVAASSITLNFAGKWSFYDPSSDDPQFWADMNALGIFDGVTPLTFSLTLNDTDPGVNPANGVYGVTGFRFNVLNSTVKGTGGQLSAAAGTYFNAAGLTGSVGSYIPSFIQFGGLWGPSFGNMGPLSTLSQATAWPNMALYLQFQNGSIASSTVQFVSVPEADTMSLFGAGLLVALVWIRSRRVTSSPPSSSSPRS